MADIVIIGTAMLRSQRGEAGHAARAPSRVPRTNPISTEMNIRPRVHGMALPIRSPTRAG